MVDYDGVTRTYNVANQMTNDGTNTLTYDNNGNLKNDGTNAYTWDRANRLLSVGNHSYVYDGLGNRVQQTVSSVVTDYLNDVQPGLTNLLKQDDGTTVEHFVHAPRGIHAVDDGTDWNFYAQDGLGSVRGLVDDAAAVVSSHSYSPIGVPDSDYGAGFWFTGEQTDENDNLYLRARYMNPNLGTFLSLDPFEGIQNRPMSLNGYSWVEGNMPNMVDPSGKTCTLPGNECSFVRNYIDGWLETATRLNIPSITNLSNEAFAIMIGAKAIFEDGSVRTAGGENQLGNEFLSQVGIWWVARGLITGGRGLTGDVSPEISFGPANIPLNQAHYVAEWCIENPEFDISNFQTDYWSTWYPQVPILGDSYLDDRISLELISITGTAGTDATWYEWLSVTMLEAADRASKYHLNNDLSSWQNPRNIGDPISAYIIAQGQVAYTETDETLYDLANWTSKGGHYVWVQAMQSIKDNLQSDIQWMQAATWLPWTEQEDAILTQLP